jgi:transcriptional regulator with XRE-family HTH domain
MQDKHSRLIELRKAMRLSQRELAIKLECTQATISGSERGIMGRKARVFLSKNLLARLREQCLVNTDWLLTGNGEMFISQANINNLPSDEALLQAMQKLSDEYRRKVRLEFLDEVYHRLRKELGG